MAPPIFPERASLLLLGRWALNFDVDGPAQDWADDVLSWAAGVEAGDPHQEVAARAIESGALYTLADLPSPAHWGELSDLIRDAVRNLCLSTPDTPDSATRWLARMHLGDILAARGDDFDALKKVSRLWFDHETPDLHQFYLFKHAIRDVTRDGQQAHIPGLTRDSWQGDLVAAINEWMEQTPAPDLL
ncbi:hypothetical protein MWU53_13245 [Aliiroseovarius sp. S1123]|uniref:hypothetical protein n=1 Tax=unclassified Aliiroseovarius TaxID=2623558 RepID=UPI001FF45333|nr:hypothetical protein [Aliiroseovarius sp. S1123]MCK0172027.1 hypothetical protein [Aliiroseovarius sp. S1123]